jgi:hypothetical protein
MNSPASPKPPTESLPSLAHGSPDITRRKFLAGASAAAFGLTVLKPEFARGSSANSKVNLGVIGCGGRGSWIADLFAKKRQLQCGGCCRLLSGSCGRCGLKVRRARSKTLHRTFRL